MKTYFAFVIAFVLLSCGNNPNDKTTTTAVKDTSAAPADRVMTKELRDKLSPDSIIAMLKTGNQMFSSHQLTVKDNRLRISVTAKGQYPMAVVLSCLDSRVPVEEVFNQGIGDLFVARVAGNISNVDNLGSLEYACRFVGAKVILVLGHSHCGAVKSSIDGVKSGNITALLAKLRPAVDATRTTGERNSHNEEFVAAVAKKNVEFTIKNIRAKSDTLRKMERAKEIKIIGGMYDIDSGKITFY
jgi:carbonic anhydrase